MNDLKLTEHRCERVITSERDPDGYIKISSFNGTWVLHKFNYACDKCVYDGEAQYEGELMSVHDVAINYCPFCDFLLNKKFSSTGNVKKQNTNNSEHICNEIESYNQKFPHVGFSFDTDAVWKICNDEGWWILERHSLATERMVAAEEADKGELVFWSGTSINFCPFCGLKLKE